MIITKFISQVIILFEYILDKNKRGISYICEIFLSLQVAIVRSLASWLTTRLDGWLRGLIIHPTMSPIHFPFFLPCDIDVLFCYTMSARLCLFISFLPVALCRICWKDLIIFFVKYVWCTMLLSVTKLGTLIMINCDSLE
jgi:hypothetical protein